MGKVRDRNQGREGEEKIQGTRELRTKTFKAWKRKRRVAKDNMIRDGRSHVLDMSRYQMPGNVERNLEARG
jgi:hypothetical protein